MSCSESPKVQCPEDLAGGDWGALRESGIAEAGHLQRLTIVSLAKEDD